jgi:hypothetical protein
LVVGITVTAGIIAVPLCIANYTPARLEGSTGSLKESSVPISAKQHVPILIPRAELETQILRAALGKPTGEYTIVHGPNGTEAPELVRKAMGKLDNVVGVHVHARDKKYTIEGKLTNLLICGGGSTKDTAELVEMIRQRTSPPTIVVHVDGGD